MENSNANLPQINIFCEDNLPPQLRTLAQWVVWRFEGGTKVPYRINGQRADKTDRRCHNTVQMARLACESGKFDGAGFCFVEGDGLCGVDLDNCIDDAGGIKPWASQILQHFASYAEISPSGRGIKIFCYGVKPPNVRTRVDVGDGRVEFYSYPNYFTVTSQRLDGSPSDVTDCRYGIDWLCETYLRRAGDGAALEPVSQGCPLVTDGPPSADFVLKHCRAAIRRFIAERGAAETGKEGHNKTFFAACECFRWGLTTQEATSMMQQFNLNCTNGELWSPKEIWHKVKDARLKVFQDGETNIRLRELLMGYGPQQDSEDFGPIEFQRISSAELADMDTDVEYLVDRTLVAGQPCIVAGPKKSLKTSVLVDLAVSLSQGEYFLGYMPVNRTCRVAVMSGESGLATLKETAIRVAWAKGCELCDCWNLIWSTDLPRFNDTGHLDALGRFLEGDEVEVLVIDPAYLAMPSADAANLMAQGELLRGTNEVCQQRGVTLLLCHHTKKTGKANPWTPPELEEIAWAGFQEWARQWILLGRRERYEPGTGQHRLWVNTGGSAGHSALWAADIDEGEFVPGQVRRWDVTIRKAEEARLQAAEDAEARKERQKADRQAQALQQAKEEILRVMESYPDGETKTVILESAGGNTKVLRQAFCKLVETAALVQKEIRKNGRTLPGYVLLR